MKAIWNDQVIAESEHTKLVEENHYFPPGSVKQKYLKFSDTRTECPWKGTASYFHLDVDDKTLKDAAWKYPDPKTEPAEVIRDYIAFGDAVHVQP